MTLSAFDTLDDRREVWHLLHRRPPAERVRFLGWCCDRVRAGQADGCGPTPAASFGPMVAAARRCDRADERLTNAVWLDLLFLAANWRLDFAAVAGRLAELARA